DFLGDYVKTAYEERTEKKQSEPWKWHTARLQAALEEFKTDARRVPGGDYVAKMVGQAQPLLSGLEKGAAANAANLIAWRGQNPPKSTTVYKGVSTAVVKPPAEKPAE